MGSTLKVKNLLLGSKFFPVREDNILKGLYLPGKLIGSHKSCFPAVKMLEKNIVDIKAIWRVQKLLTMPQLKI